MNERRWQWARWGDGYEVSTAGDRRFSALIAKLPDGRTIEEAYQLDVKGYRKLGFTSWRDGKGKSPVRHMSREELWQAYLDLWLEWSVAFPGLIEQLQTASKEKRLLTDRFAISEISQARALGAILNTYTFNDLQAVCEIKPGGRLELTEPLP